MSAAASVPCVFFGGSRALPACGAALVARVVGRVASAGTEVAIGCCSGADQLALSAVLGAGPAAVSRLVVFAAFGPGGEGAVGPLSALAEVRLAASHGARVAWWAGGPSSVPVRARLVRRARAAVASGCGPAVFFLASPASRGSLAAAAVAVAAGRPVWAFGVGFLSAPLPVPGVIGRWVPGCFAGVSSCCWRWSAPPAAPVLF